MFHERAKLWDEANAEYDNPGSNHGAIEKYENYSRRMSEMYKVLGDSIQAGLNALEQAGLTEATPEGKKLFEEIRQRYIDEHSVGSLEN